MTVVPGMVTLYDSLSCPDCRMPDGLCHDAFMNLPHVLCSAACCFPAAVVPFGLVCGAIFYAFNECRGPSRALFDPIANRRMFRGEPCFPPGGIESVFRPGAEHALVRLSGTIIFVSAAPAATSCRDRAPVFPWHGGTLLRSSIGATSLREIHCCRLSQAPADETRAEAIDTSEHRVNSVSLLLSQLCMPGWARGRQADCRSNPPCPEKRLSCEFSA